MPGRDAVFHVLQGWMRHDGGHDGEGKKCGSLSDGIGGFQPVLLQDRSRDAFFDYRCHCTGPARIHGNGSCTSDARQLPPEHNFSGNG